MNTQAAIEKAKKAEKLYTKLEGYYKTADKWLSRAEALGLFKKRDLVKLILGETWFEFFKRIGSFANGVALVWNWIF